MTEAEALEAAAQDHDDEDDVVIVDEKAKASIVVVVVIIVIVVIVPPARRRMAVSSIGIFSGDFGIDSGGATCMEGGAGLSWKYRRFRCRPQLKFDDMSSCLPVTSARHNQRVGDIM